MKHPTPVLGTILLLSTETVDALGINCRGSQQCDPINNGMGDIQTVMQKGISNGRGTDFFDTGSMQL